MQFILNALWAVIKGVLFIAGALLEGVTEAGKKAETHSVADAPNPRQDPNSRYDDGPGTKR